MSGWLMRMTALAAAVALLLTAVHVVQRTATRLAAVPWAAPDTAQAEVSEGSRCSIYHARFGGTRARLVRIMRGEVANFVVIELPRGNRVMPSVQRAWLRSSFGEGEPLWLGEFASPDTALARAARLCPAAARCQPGEPDCGPSERPVITNFPRETHVRPDAGERGVTMLHALLSNLRQYRDIQSSGSEWSCHSV